MKFSTPDMRSFFSLCSLLLTLLLIQSCGDNRNPYQVDYSTVPEPYDTTKALQDTATADNLKVYVMKEGSGPFQVSSRDQITIRYTGRTADGKIFDSSYANGQTAPDAFRNLTPVPITLSGSRVSTIIEGFRRGILLWGMKEGEKRTIVIPPALGYGENTNGSSSSNLQGKTLVFDIELVSIL